MIDELAVRRNANKIKRVRKNVMRMSQKNAAHLLIDGGESTFAAYENGAVPAPQPLMVLIQLMEEYPDVVMDLLR